MRIIEILQPIPLQRAKIIGIAQLHPQRFENSPILIALFTAELTLQMLAEILLHGIVIEQGVVHIKQKDDFPMLTHAATSCSQYCGTPAYVNRSASKTFSASTVLLRRRGHRT